MTGTKKLDSEVYTQNIKFWERAWNAVKTPYTQMPDLPYLQTIPDTLQQAGASKILDLGCGSGWLSIYLARAGFEVHGIDIAPHALELAQQWAEQESLTAKFSVADIAEIPFS